MIGRTICLGTECQSHNTLLALLNQWEKSTHEKSAQGNTEYALLLHQRLLCRPQFNICYTH